MNSYPLLLISSASHFGPATDYGFDAAQFGEVGKSLFSKEHNIEQSIFLFNFSLSIETKISGKTVTDTIKVDKNYFRLRSSTSPKAEKVLSSSCGCRSNVATALVFPDYFTKSDREFGYQVKKSAQYRTGFKTLVRFVLKPYEDNDRLQQIGLEPTHKRHYTYNTSKSKVVEAVRMCARFFQIFYPTSIDKEHFTNAVDDICESVMPAASVNNSNNHYHNAQPPAYPGTTATYTASPLAATNNNWSNDPYQQLDAAMEAIARLQVKDILRHGTGEPVRKQLVEAALKERMKTMLHTRMRPVLTTAMNKETSEYVLDRSQDSYH
ncbi:hypothetical protein EC991_006248 [Linnemannia zychae]|nr:hypothetical protein EC991_006248 [Linnemannia zychae]